MRTGSVPAAGPAPPEDFPSIVLPLDAGPGSCSCTRAGDRTRSGSIRAHEILMLATRWGENERIDQPRSAQTCVGSITPSGSHLSLSLSSPRLG